MLHSFADCSALRIEKHVSQPDVAAAMTLLLPPLQQQRQDRRGATTLPATSQENDF
jgi:hypothetical protein